MVFGDKEFRIPQIPDNLLEIVENGGLVQTCEKENRLAAEGKLPEKKPLPPAPEYTGEHTLAEKILMRNTHSASLRPGDIVMARPTACSCWTSTPAPSIRSSRAWATRSWPTRRRTASSTTTRCPA